MTAIPRPRDPSRRRRLAAILAAAVFAVVVLGYGAWWPTSRLFGAMLISLPPSPAAPRIALTFDDGPDPIVTPRVLDALRDAGARATFFVCGERAGRAPELVARVVAEGHAIGNHSFRHDALVLRSGTAIGDDLARTNAAIRLASGIDSLPIRWFRPPYGLRDPRVLARADSLGMTTVSWNTSPRDWQSVPAARIVERVLAEARDGAIVLLHDGDATADRGREETAAALPELLRALSARGFRCVSLDEVPGASLR